MSRSFADILASRDAGARPFNQDGVFGRAEAVTPPANAQIRQPSVADKPALHTSAPATPAPALKVQHRTGAIRLYQPELPSLSRQAGLARQDLFHPEPAIGAEVSRQSRAEVRKSAIAPAALAERLERKVLRPKSTFNVQIAETDEGLEVRALVVDAQADVGALREAVLAYLSALGLSMSRFILNGEVIAPASTSLGE